MTFTHKTSEMTPPLARSGDVQKQVIDSAGTLATRLNMPKGPPPQTPPRRASGAAPRARGGGDGHGVAAGSPPPAWAPTRQRWHPEWREGVRGGGLLAGSASTNGYR